MRWLLYIATVLLVSSVWSCFNNEYLTRRDYTVIVIDKFKEERCHKHRCKLYMKGLFKTEEGDFFDLDLTMASYNRLVVGKTAVFELRPMDIKQTAKQNILYLIGPLVVLCLAGLFSAVSLGDISDSYRRRRLKNKQDNTQGN